MFNWAVGREYLDRTLFRRGNQTLVRQELEDNRRRRRIPQEEAKALLGAAPAHLQPLIIIALDAGLRRGEMLAMTWADVDVRPGWLRLRGETTKSGKMRWVPVATTRLKAVLDFLRLDADGSQKPPNAPVCSNEAGESLKYFRSTWIITVLKAHGLRPAWKKRNRFRAFTHECLVAFRRIDLRWHDLRHEYASRLVERGVPLSQVRDLLATHRSSRRSATTTRLTQRCWPRLGSWTPARPSRFFQDRMSSDPRTCRQNLVQWTRSCWKT
jgi:integrase